MPGLEGFNLLTEVLDPPTGQPAGLHGSQELLVQVFFEIPLLLPGNQLLLEFPLSLHPSIVLALHFALMVLRLKRILLYNCILGFKLALQTLSLTLSYCK